MQVDLRWMAIPAGRAVIEVREGPDIGSRKTYQLWGNVLSSKITDAIYHVDNTIEAFVDRETLLPYKFLLHMFETHQKKETRVIFDHEHGQAAYWAQRESKKWGDEKIDRIDTLVRGAKDMFSALYFARTLDYRLHQKQSFFVYENRQNLSIELEPVANELILGKSGAFQCWKIRVLVTLNNVLRPTGDMYLWLSDDSKKYLVKFDAKVKIGSLIGELVSIRDRS